jgi:uncharacterized protein YkwD
MKFKRLFLPIPENDHTPHLLQQAAVVVMSVLILLSFVAVNLQALLWQSSSWLVGTVLPAVVVNLTNDERQSMATSPLQRNALLDEAARLKAEHMAAESYFAHYSPDGVSPWYWFEEVSYTYAHAGENLAIHFTDSSAVVDAWMKSPTHKANIVDAKYTEIGVGTAKGVYDGYETVFVVQLFGTPAAPLVAAAPTPAPAPVIVEIAAVAEPEVLAVEATEAVLVVEAPEEVLVVEEIPPEPVPSEPVAAPVTLGSQQSQTPPAPVKVVVGPVEETQVYETAVPSSFSSYVATSSGLTPVSIGSVSGTTAPSVSFSQALVTQPSVVLQMIYLTLGLLVAVLLLVSIVIGINHARPLQVVYGVGLLMLMSGLFYIHVTLTTSVVIAAEPEAVLER